MNTGNRHGVCHSCSTLLSPLENPGSINSDSQLGNLVVRDMTNLGRGGKLNSNKDQVSWLNVV